MLGLSYVTRYAGMDATLGVAFAETGVPLSFLRRDSRLDGRFPHRNGRGQQCIIRQLAKKSRPGKYMRSITPAPSAT